MWRNRHRFHCHGGRAGCLSWFRTAGLCVVAVLMLGAGAIGQTADPEELPQTADIEEPPPTARTHPNDPSVWNVEAMMLEAVGQIARRYNLNTAQEEFTRMLLVSKVREFMEHYEDDVRLLLKESIMFRLDPKSATPEALQDWAERAEPVYAAARDAILDGNKEWGGILTDEQKKTHQKDLDEMAVNFERVGRVLEGMKEGEGLSAWVGAGRSGRTGKTTGQVSRNPGGSVVENRLPEDNWLTYVEKFIEVYHLDEKQQNAARASIHKDARAKARNVRDRNKREFDKIEAALQSLPKDPKEARGRRDELDKRKANLEKPVRLIFIQMTARLHNLPTAAQQKKADPAKKKELEGMYEDLAGSHSAKQKAVTGTKTRPDVVKPSSTQPAATQPAEAAPKQNKPTKASADKTPASQGHAMPKRDDGTGVAKPRATEPENIPPKVKDKPAKR